MTYEGVGEKISQYCSKTNNLVTFVNLNYGAAQNPTAFALFPRRNAASEQIGMSGQGQCGIHLDCPENSLGGWERLLPEQISWNQIVCLWPPREIGS